MAGVPVPSGLAAFWDCLDEAAKRELLTVCKDDIPGGVYTCKRCLKRLENVLVHFDWEIKREREARAYGKKANPAALSVFGLADGSFVSAAVQATCNTRSVFGFVRRPQGFAYVGEMGAAIFSHRRRLPVSKDSCWYCKDKVYLKFIDMLTYPRPIRKFELLLARDETLGALRELISTEVGLESPAQLVLRSRNAALGPDYCTIRDARLEMDQTIVISKVVHKAAVDDGAEGARNRQFVGDLLFGNLGERPRGHSTIESFSLEHGFALLGHLLNYQMHKKIWDSWAAEERAEENARRLLIDLEWDKKQAEDKKSKKRSKKEKQRERARLRAEEEAAAKAKAEAKAAKEAEDAKAAKAAQTAKAVGAANTAAPSVAGAAAAGAAAAGGTSPKVGDGGSAGSGSGGEAKGAEDGVADAEATSKKKRNRRRKNKHKAGGAVSAPQGASKEQVAALEAVALAEQKREQERLKAQQAEQAAKAKAQAKLRKAAAASERRIQRERENQQRSASTAVASVAPPAPPSSAAPPGAGTSKGGAAPAAARSPTATSKGATPTHGGGAAARAGGGAVPGSSKAASAAASAAAALPAPAPAPGPAPLNKAAKKAAARQQRKVAAAAAAAAGAAAAGAAAATASATAASAAASAAAVSTIATSKTILSATSAAVGNGTSTVPTSVAGAPSAAALGKAAFCAMCGTGLVEGANFCSSCGSRVGAGPNSGGGATAGGGPGAVTATSSAVASTSMPATAGVVPGATLGEQWRMAPPVATGVGAPGHSVSGAPGAFGGSMAPGLAVADPYGLAGAGGVGAAPPHSHPQRASSTPDRLPAEAGALASTGHVAHFDVHGGVYNGGGAVDYGGGGAPVGPGIGGFAGVPAHQQRSLSTGTMPHGHGGVMGAPPAHMGGYGGRHGSAGDAGDVLGGWGADPRPRGSSAGDADVADPSAASGMALGAFGPMGAGAFSANAGSVASTAGPPGLASSTGSLASTGSGSGESYVPGYAGMNGGGMQARAGTGGGAVTGSAGGDAATGSSMLSMFARSRGADSGYAGAAGGAMWGGDDSGGAAAGSGAPAAAPWLQHLQAKSDELQRSNIEASIASFLDD